MNLREIILTSHQYEDTDEIIHMVFAKKTENSFEQFSEAKVLKLNLDEIEMDLNEIQTLKCPGFNYFLEINLIQEILDDIKDLEEYKSDDEKVNRIIYYAENDA